MEKVEKRAFQKGWFKVPNGDVAKTRVRLMAALDVTTRVAFLNRMKGKTTNTKEDIENIERIFGEVGIAKKDVWGEV